MLICTSERKCTFYFKFIGDDITNSSQFIIIPLIHFLIVADICFIQNILGSRTANTINIGKTYFASFVFW